MEKISDFAQKLLDDLRLRKERMSASQKSELKGFESKDAYAYSKATYKSSRKPEAVKSTGSKAGGTQNRPSGGRKSVSTGQASNQIVPFEGGKKPQQKGDLSMALDFTLENGGKIRTESSGTSSIFSFLLNIGRRQVDYGKMDRRNTEQYSIEIGSELLKGAMDLEESLTLLVNMQETSDYSIMPQRKSRLTLLEEDEDDDENTVKMAELKLRLAALTYSSGVLIPSMTIKTNSLNSIAVQTREVQNSKCNSKLMVIDELPENVDSKVTTKKEFGNKKVEGIITKRPAQESIKKAEQRTKDSTTPALPPAKQKETIDSKIPPAQDTVTSQGGKTWATRNPETCIPEMTEPLTESENHLKLILMKSQLFMNTAQALFKLNVPISILHANSHNYHDQDSKLILNCGYEVMTRKGRRKEDFEKLKLYGRDGREDSPLEYYLPKMLEDDVYNKEPDLNCMWNLGWHNTMVGFHENDDVIRDAEKYVLNGLLDEITRDLFTSVYVTV
ncbi:hypothetical protein F3Y22_tig00112407pilonHSYRG00010 [Hibiscus syriacus]|uniref:Uncharacterized protein n=1 Tax=Hibiscus syriacus TaxID=106335 RepID=A0A6A2YA91_HIBSY|nr:hypothetical protein F3Y22_tig00112407pilonHSYRG00010 [Hibiscus syriacus]